MTIEQYIESIFNSLNAGAPVTRITGKPHIHVHIIGQIATATGLTFTGDNEFPAEGEVCFANSREVRPEFRLTFGEQDILDYLYAVLFCRPYQEKYREYVQTEFSSIPDPKDTTVFWRLVESGRKLRRIHLWESPEKVITTFPVEGNNLVGRIYFESGKVYINYDNSFPLSENLQYFGNVPEIAWNLFTGSYQPAQKWLEDRKGQALDTIDLENYQKIIAALTATGRVIEDAFPTGIE